MKKVHFSEMHLYHQRGEFRQWSVRSISPKSVCGKNNTRCTKTEECV